MTLVEKLARMSGVADMDYKKLFQDALAIISKVAPAIGEAIGGPGGMATGYIIPILAQAFGVKPNDMGGLLTNIINDPDSETKLSDINKQHCGILCSMTEGWKHPSEIDLNIAIKWDVQETSLS